MKKSKKGFTIVELVIVIAVIGILAAVLIPTFTSVIDNANRSAAQSNIKNASTTLLADQADATLPDGVVIVGGDYYATVENHQVGALVEGKFEVSSSGQSVYVKATEAFSNKFITGVTYYTIKSSTETTENTESSPSYELVTNAKSADFASYYVKVVGTNGGKYYTEYKNADLTQDVTVYIPAGTAPATNGN